MFIEFTSNASEKIITTAYKHELTPTNTQTHTYFTVLPMDICASVTTIYPSHLAIGAGCVQVTRFPESPAR